jgi:MFS family permease
MSSATDDAAARRSTHALIRLEAGTFVAFMTIGLPIPVRALYVGHGLGYGNVVVGLSVGIQFLATVLTRSYAGHTADREGAKGVMRRGIVFCAASGIASIISAVIPNILRPRSITTTAALAGS